ncbi:MAG TPA: hypothetical protein VET83_06885 [Candidatus Dormibacteraeota bacterium]|nr:hypothetical protein [Candidatus Dormibacteraeota bacterium]
MRDYTLTHLSDAVLLRDLATLVARDRVATATLLAHIAEVDARRLFIPEGYPSMHAYCVGELRLSEDAAYKRIQAARAARRFPALLPELAEGRLHLTAVSLIAPHLTPENVTELIEAATHKGRSEIEVMVARRFSPDQLPPRIQAISAPIGVQLAPEQVGAPFAGSTDEARTHTRVESPAPQSGSDSQERYFLPLTIAKSTREKLRQAQALLSHAVPAGDVAQLFDRALDALITQLEKRKLGAVGGRPGRKRRALEPATSEHPTVGSRYVPAHVRRAVWERDQGQCTFVSSRGNRCKATRFLEFDHVDPVARGGEATVEKVRLRCRAHNQYEAERVFGWGFMNRKRLESRLARAASREIAAARAAARERVQDVLAGLRGLGCRADESRRAAEFSETLQGATLEERVHAALSFLGRKSPPRSSP